MRRTGVLLVVMLALQTLAGGLAAARGGAAAWAALDEEVFAALAASPTGETAFVVVLEASADLDDAAAMDPGPARKRAAAAALVRTARHTQAPVLAVLAALRRRGQISAYRPFFSVNAVAVTGRMAAVHALAQLPGVARIEVEEDLALPAAHTAGGEPLEVSAVEPGIKQIKAHRAWALGYRGQGTIVANIDTGVRYTHEALAANYRCRNEPDHAGCWHDAVNGERVPYDDHDHGTHTMGTAAGRLGIGAARTAKWIACKAFTSTGTGTIADIMECSDFFLGLALTTGTLVFTPDVINNSWGAGRGNTVFNAMVDSWNAAGIHATFSIGGSGPGCGTSGSPAEYTNAFGIGAVDANDVITGFSGRGPASAPNGGSVKPDVVAPGIAVRSASADCDTCYVIFSGTSMATAHAAGTLALVLSKNAGLSPAAARMIVEGSAKHISNRSCGGRPKDNNVYGHGRIDALAAVNATP